MDGPQTDSASQPLPLTRLSIGSSPCMRRSDVTLAHLAKHASSILEASLVLVTSVYDALAPLKDDPDRHTPSHTCIPFPILLNRRACTPSPVRIVVLLACAHVRCRTFFLLEVITSWHGTVIACNEGGAELHANTVGGKLWQSLSRNDDLAGG